MKSEKIRIMCSRMKKNGTKKSITLADKVLKNETRTKDRVFQYNYDKRLEKRIYELFLTLVDKNTKNRLLAIGEIEEEIKKKIMSNTGWALGRAGAYFNEYSRIDNTETNYEIYRSEDGYYLNNEGKSSSVINAETAFFENNFYELVRMHLLLSEKERIMFGNYQLINENVDPELAELISEYLGFVKSEENILDQPAVLKNV